MKLEPQHRRTLANNIWYNVREQTSTKLRFGFTSRFSDQANPNLLSRSSRHQLIDYLENILSNAKHNLL